MSKSIASFTENELQFLQKAERYCAADEQCRSSVRAKLVTWGVPREIHDKIMKHLVDQGYINEQRFARIFCESKLRNQKWGKIKLVYHLRIKQIPSPIIEQSINSIDHELYTQVLTSLAEKRLETLEPEDGPKKNHAKMVSFLAQRGFEVNEIESVIKPYFEQSENE